MAEESSKLPQSSSEILFVSVGIRDAFHQSAEHCEDVIISRSIIRGEVLELDDARP